MAVSPSPHPSDILLVADDPVHLTTLTNILNVQGHRLQRAHSGEAALKMAGHAPPDVILLAVDLPQMEGYAVCERLQAEAATAAIPVIFISPTDAPLDRARLFAAGGADYLTTPFEAAEIVARVETQVALRAARRQLAVQEEQRQQESKEDKAQVQYLADLVDNVSDAVISTDAAFHIKSWNKAAERLYGWRAEEVVGHSIMTVTELRYPDHSPDEVVAEFFAQGQWRGEIIQTHRDGRELWVEASVSLLRDERGQPVGAVAINQDITEQKQLQAALRKSEQRFERIVNGLPQLIAYVDKELYYRFVNQTYQEIFQISPETIIGQCLPDFIGPEAFAKARPHLERVLQGDVVRYYELYTYSPDNRRHIDGYLIPDIDADGEVVGYYAVLTDISLYKEAEEALRQSEQRYRAIVENSADGLVLYDQTGAVIEWNSALAEITGIPQAEALGQLAWELHARLAQPPYLLEVEQIEAAMRAFLSGQESADGVLYEYDIKDVSTGERRSLQTRMFSLRLDDELAIGNVIRDVTEQKQTEEALRKNEAQYRLLVTNLPEMDVFLFDREMRFWIAEGSLMERGRLAPQDIEGKRLPDIMDPERRDFFIPTYQRALAGKHVKADFTYEGQHYYHQTLPLIDEQGEIYGGLALTQDITEQKRAEEALREGEEKFRTIANNVPGLVLRYKLNPDGSDELLFLSEGVEDIYEVSQEAALGDVSILWQMIHPDDLEAYAASVQASAETLSFWEREHRILLPDGRVKWLHGRGLPRKMADGSVVWDTLGVDITQRKELEAELIRARDAAEAANKAKSIFLANMSHELRTPLNGVLGYAQVLQHYTSLDPEQQRHVKTIEQSGNHLLTLINDVLDIAKIEAGKISLRLATFDLAEFLTNLSNIIRVRAEQKGVAFVTDFAPDLPSLVRGDEKRLRQILINLLGNAVKFTDEGQVFFTVTDSNRLQRDGAARLRFVIKDTGQGIPAEELENIFKPFHQAVGSQKFQEGTGLGLAISQHLAQLMDSAIQVESQPGLGSAFWLEVELPVVGNTLSTEARPLPKIVGFRGTAPTILVVDDVSTNRDVLHNFLTTLGFKVIGAEDGLQGLAMAKALDPDLILADLRMPRLDGYEMVRRLRQVETLQSVPVIGISASAYAEDAQKSLDAGCDAFLAKPVDLDELIRLLTQHLTLEWIYQDYSANAASNPVESLPFILPPPEALRELQTMVDIGDIDGIKRQLAAIENQGNQYASFVAEIGRLANSFEIGAIERMLRVLGG